jgi:hypothetical protein
MPMRRIELEMALRHERAALRTAVQRGRRDAAARYLEEIARLELDFELARRERAMAERAARHSAA